MTPASLDDVFTFLASALTPLGDLTSDPALAERTLARLGWRPPPGVDLADALKLNVDTLLAALTAVMQSTEQELGDAAVMEPRYAQLVADVAQLLDQVDAVAASLPRLLAGAADYLDKTDIAEQLPLRLLDYVSYSALWHAHPSVPALLRLLGVMRVTHFDADPTIYQTDHERLVVDWQQLAQLLTKPQPALTAEYDWGTSQLASDRLLANLAAVAAAINIPSRVIGGQQQAAAGIADVHLLINGGPGVIAGALGVEIARSAGTLGSSDAGLEVTPVVVGGTSSLPVGDSLTLELVSDLDLAAPIALTLEPSGVRLASGKSTVTGSLSVGLHYARNDGTLSQLLHADGIASIEAREIFAELGASSDGKSTPDGWLRLGVAGCKITSSTAGADGFVQRVAPTQFAANCDVQLRLSRLSGFSFEGSGDLGLVIASRARVGPVTISALRFSIGAAASGVEVKAGADVDVVLGPLAVSVQDIGVAVRLIPGRGNLGSLQLDVDFSPPDGAAVALQTAVASGAGYLSHDPAAKQYAGAVHLALASLSLGAVGLLSTQLPGGSPGYSLVVLVSVKFTPAIELGFGFSIDGVGGLVGVNRTVALDPLRAGLQAGSLDAVLFPADVAKNPQKVVSDLEQYFPTAAWPVRRRADGRAALGRGRDVHR